MDFNASLDFFFNSLHGLRGFEDLKCVHSEGQKLHNWILTVAKLNEYNFYVPSVKQ